MSWNHNSHYHPLVLASVPSRCRRALDIGCGTGEFARKLAHAADEVAAVDSDERAIEAARKRGSDRGNLSYLAGDFLALRMEDGRFDFASGIASFHHMEFEAALRKAARLLAPGGRLVLLGLYRQGSFAELLSNAASIPANWVLSFIHRNEGAEADAPMATKDPAMSLRQIREAAGKELPGCRIRRLLLWRYLLEWEKPSGSESR